MTKEEMKARVQQLLEEDRKNNDDKVNMELKGLLEQFEETELPEEMTVKQYKKYIRTPEQMDVDKEYEMIQNLKAQD